jgi:hypothetical protein
MLKGYAFVTGNNITPGMSPGLSVPAWVRVDSISANSINGIQVRGAHMMVPNWYEHPITIGVTLGLFVGGLSGFLVGRRRRRR